jgi:hypothetical protein
VYIYFSIELTNAVPQKVAVMIQSIHTSIAMTTVTISLWFCFTTDLALPYFLGNHKVSFLVYFFELFQAVRIGIRLLSFPENVGQKYEIKCV